jgi:RNA polymerase primary sigma factor
VERALCWLRPNERDILRWRLALSATHEHTLEEIGARFGLRRERIRQIEVTALRQLRHAPPSPGLESFIRR